MFLAGCEESVSASSPRVELASHQSRADAAREFVAQLDVLGRRLLAGDACFPELVDAAHLALLAVEQQPEQRDGVFHYEIASDGRARAVLSALQDPTTSDTRFEIKVNGSRLYTGLPAPFTRDFEQEAEFLFAVTESGALSWMTCIFESFIEPNQGESVAALKQPPFVTGAVVRYSADKRSLTWHPATIQVERGAETATLVRRNVGPPEFRASPSEAEHQHLQEIVRLLRSLRR